MHIARPNIEEDAKKTLVERFSGILATEDAEVLEAKDQGERRLAYEISDFKSSLYNIVRVKPDNNKATDEFQRLAETSDDIIRYMVVHKDEDKQQLEGVFEC